MAISMTEITCACGCGRKKKVRTADVERGWGRYYNKGCATEHRMAMKSEKAAK